MSTHRKMRDIQADNYQKRVAMFIREMVDSPVAFNDDYTMRMTLNTSKASEGAATHFTSIANEGRSVAGTSDANNLSKMIHNNRYGHKTSKSTNNNTMNEIPIKDFRFASYRTEKERIQATIKSNQEFWDSVPSPQKQRYERSLRPRDEKLEIGPQFHFTAKTGVERVYDQLCSRITSAFQEKDIASRDLKSTIRNSRRLNQTTSPKELLPSIHNKTHFKAATSIFLKSQLERSLKDNSNFLSRALRDVSPNFASFSVDTATNTVKESMTQETGIRQSAPIIKHNIKQDRKIQNVSFAKNEAVKSENEDFKRSSKVVDSSVTNQGNSLVLII